MTKKRLQSIAQASFWSGIVLFGWIVFWPEPYALAIAIPLVLPWVAVAMVIRFPDILSLGLDGRRGRGVLIGIFLIPCLALGVRALLDFTFLDVWWLLLIVLVLITVPGLILTLILPPRPKHWSEWAVLTLALAGYGYGATVQFDTFPDHAPTQTYRATVADKYVSQGKSWSYNFDLAPWGPDRSKSTVRVPGELYARIKPGMQVCATVHPGFIGLRWYRVDFC